MSDRVAELKRILDLGVLEEAGNIPCASFPDAYFPQHNADGAYSTLLVQSAIKGCIECPLMTACADYAIEAGEEYGIWGGLTAIQRRKMKRARIRTKRHEAA